MNHARASSDTIAGEIPDYRKIRYAAMDLLARREHSQKELRQKLSRRFGHNEAVMSVVEALADEGYQSDERFAEAFVNSRRQRGQGPVRIAVELRDKGVSSDIAELYIDSGDRDWWGLARDLRQRRFGLAAPVDRKMAAKQMRFLQYRGFTPDQVRAAMAAEEAF